MGSFPRAGLRVISPGLGGGTAGMPRRGGTRARFRPVGRLPQEGWRRAREGSALPRAGRARVQKVAARSRARMRSARQGAVRPRAVRTRSRAARTLPREVRGPPLGGRRFPPEDATLPQEGQPALLEVRAWARAWVRSCAVLTFACLVHEVAAGGIEGKGQLAVAQHPSEADIGVEDGLREIAVSHPFEMGTAGYSGPPLRERLDGSWRSCRIRNPRDLRGGVSRE